MEIPSAVAAAGDVTWRSSPSNQNVPASARKIPDTTLMRVDLPAPLSPTSATTSPGDDLEVDLGQGLDGAEALADPLQAKQMAPLSCVSPLQRSGQDLVRSRPDRAR